MKKILFTISLALISVFAHAQEEVNKASGWLMFNENDEVKEAFVLVSDANLREKPSIKATTIAQLPIATKVTILERTTDSLTLNGFRAPWFRISANGKTGYLWSGILTRRGLNQEGAKARRKQNGKGLSPIILLLRAFVSSW